MSDIPPKNWQQRLTIPPKNWQQKVNVPPKNWQKHLAIPPKRVTLQRLFVHKNVI